MNEIKYVDEKTCFPKGFKSEGISCGIRKKGKRDLALIVSEKMCSAAGVFTRNKVKGAPILVSQAHLKDNMAQVIICNSGNANTCNPDGIKIAETICDMTAKSLNLNKEDIIVCSTGVIGEKLSIEPFEYGIPKISQELSEQGMGNAAEAIMTTDTVKKMVAVEFYIENKLCKMVGIAKGSGMINPNMATMLGFIITDVNISPEILDATLKKDIDKTFNQICVDGDTSTNDTVAILANGCAENEMIDGDSKELMIFAEALEMVTTKLSKMLAADGEGATKLIECNVCGAENDSVAKDISKTVISSDLLKAAIFGADANWGRILCAIGYAKGEFSVDNISVEISSSRGKVCVCENSRHKEYDEEIATGILSEKEITIDIDMHCKTGKGTAWGCDLTYDYVRINGEYRS